MHSKFCIKIIVMHYTHTYTHDVQKNMTYLYNSCGHFVVFLEIKENGYFAFLFQFWQMYSASGYSVVTENVHNVYSMQNISYSSKQ